MYEMILLLPEEEEWERFYCVWEEEAWLVGRGGSKKTDGHLDRHTRAITFPLIA